MLSEDECSTLTGVYEDVVNTLNGNFEDEFDINEVSQEVANFATKDPGMSDNIGRMNELTTQIVNGCNSYVDEEMVKAIHGSLNQNAVDSIALYSEVPLKKIPIFTGELTSYASLATQKVGVSLHGLYNGLLNKLGIVTHEVPNYVSNKLASVAGSAGGDDATLVLGLGVAGTIGLGIFVGKRINNLD